MSLVTARQNLLTPLAPINLYSEPAFLGVVADVYHAGRPCRVRDYVVGDEVFRLLEVDGVGALTSQRFIDMHESLGRLHAPGHRLGSLPRLEGVALPAVRLDEFSERPDWRDASGAPTTLWEGFATWADYLALLQSRQGVGEDRRRARRLAERVGPLEFRVDDSDTDVLSTAFEWKSRRDLSLGRADMLADGTHRRFFHELRARGLLRASTLRGGDGQLLALWLGAVHGARWSGWIFGFNPDPALSRFSLGQQLLYPMLEHSYQSGHSEFDFSIGLEPYKLKFATHVRPLAMAGSLAPAERAARAARHWLARHPWWQTQARALRRHISPARSRDMQSPPARQS
jgi:hypothetical protein